MNQTILRELDMMVRADRFIVDNPITPPNVRLTTAHTALVASVTALQAAATQQTFGAGESATGVDLRLFFANQLRAFLRDLNRSARSLEPQVPGISSPFRMPKSGSYPALIAATEAIIDAATPHSALFVDLGLPATFLADLAALLTAFQTATGRKASGVIGRGLGTAFLKAKAKEGLAAATDLDTVIRNHFRNQPEVIQGWAIARRIERSRRKADENPVPPSGGSGDGSGTTPNGTLTA